MDPKPGLATPGGVWGVGGLAGARSRTRHRRWCARRRCVARQGMWRRRAVVCLAGMPGICRPDPRLGATRELVPPPGSPTVRLGAVGARCRRSSPPSPPSPWVSASCACLYEAPALLPLRLLRQLRRCLDNFKFKFKLKFKFEHEVQVQIRGRRQGSRAGLPGQLQVQVQIWT